MRIISYTLILSVVLSSNLLADYQSEWTYENYYKAVEGCRESIVFPNAKAYIDRGLENKQDLRAMINESIEILPIFDKMATDTCFCIYNEIAKDYSYKDYSKGIDFESYGNTPRCKRLMENSFKTLEDDIKKLRLD